jgi:hypothetical protein
MLYNVVWHKTPFGPFTHYEALRALRLFYEGGTIVPA